MNHLASFCPSPLRRPPFILFPGLSSGGKLPPQGICSICGQWGNFRSAGNEASCCQCRPVGTKIATFSSDNFFWFFLQRLEYSCIAYHHIFAAICQFMEDILSLASVTFYVGDNFRASVPSKMSCFAARPQIEAHLVLADTFARNSHLVPRHGRHQEKDAGACATENCPVWKDLSIKLIRRWRQRRTMQWTDATCANRFNCQSIQNSGKIL